MDTDYEESLRRLLVHEGGYSNHPSDPGGPTNFGITLADYRRYVKSNATAADVRAMRLSDAKSIYRQKYWLALGCDRLPRGVDYVIFDYGVNSGVGRAGKVLRRVLGLSDSASTVTDEVLRAVAKRDPKQLVNAICDERLRFLKSLRTWSVFGAGWERRVSECRVAALRMSDSNVVTLPVTPPKSSSESGKGAVPPPVVAKNVVQGGGAVSGAALLTWIQSHPQVIVLAGVAVFVGVGTVLYLVERRHQSRQEAATPGTVVVPEKMAA